MQRVRACRGPNVQRRSRKSPQRTIPTLATSSRIRRAFVACGVEGGGRGTEHAQMPKKVMLSETIIHFRNQPSHLNRVHQSSPVSSQHCQSPTGVKHAEVNFTFGDACVEDARSGIQAHASPRPGQQAPPGTGHVNRQTLRTQRP